MADKHTPGPWKWNDQYLGLRQVTNTGGKGVLTFTPYEGLWFANDCDRETSAANARLIAAAPELLAALESMILANKPTTRNAVALHNAYRVIAKVRGDQ